MQGQAISRWHEKAIPRVGVRMERLTIRAAFSGATLVERRAPVRPVPYIHARAEQALGVPPATSRAGRRERAILPWSVKDLHRPTFVPGASVGGFSSTCCQLVRTPVTSPRVK
jgi:hypothetical protein